MAQLGIALESDAGDTIEGGGGGHGKGGEDHEDGSDEGDSEGKCSICWVEEVQITFVPCGHQVCCLGCGKAFTGRKCPICQTIVDQAVRFYA